MELLWILLVVVLAGAAILVALRRRVKERHEMTRAGLEKRAIEEARSLRKLVDEREESRPENDSVVREHELPERRVTLHDEETRGMYLRDHLPEVSRLREQLAKRGVRDQTLDEVYGSVENGSDLRTVSTALSEMARRLRRGR